MRAFIEDELRKYNGSGGIAYVACSGKVYDVSQSFLWKKGTHQVTHHAGRDLTEALRQAPHGPEMLDKFPVVGRLGIGKVRTVLFVCVHNSGRSQMAEAFFNRLAKGRARATSAGTSPDSAVDPKVVEAMREISIDMSGNRPKALTLEMVEQADKLVAMGCGVEGVCPAAFVEAQDWELEDPKGKTLEDVRRIRDEIKAKVVDLLNETERSE